MLVRENVSADPQAHRKLRIEIVLWVRFHGFHSRSIMFLFELARRRRFSGEQQRQERVYVRNYRLDVASRMFDVLKSSITRTPNLHGAIISR